jgi:DNA replication protein DnaC
LADADDRPTVPRPVELVDPTLADAILDRIVHNAHKIELKGESIRIHVITLDQN